MSMDRKQKLLGSDGKTKNQKLFHPFHPLNTHTHILNTLNHQRTITLPHLPPHYLYSHSHFCILFHRSMLFYQRQK